MADHAAAARLRLVLLALVGAAALVAAWALRRGGPEVARIVGLWARHDAVLINDHLPQTIELELHEQALEAMPLLVRQAAYRDAVGSPTGPGGPLKDPSLRGPGQRPAGVAAAPPAVTSRASPRTARSPGRRVGRARSGAR
jgi:hypothetical protein